MAQNTATIHVGFMPEPNCGRGTIGIFWQCLTTIFLCVYTCLHLNVPPQPLSKRRTLLRSAIWISIGLISPELVCLKATVEWLTAASLVKAVTNKNLGTISRKQAHFLLWGGLRFEHEGKLLRCHMIGCWVIRKDSWEEKARDYAKFVLKNLPTDAIIDDRSKADLLAKVLACVQAVWVAVQAVARLQQALEISLLEVVTLAYILMALCAYAAWTSKPYGISISEHIALPEEFESILNDVPAESYDRAWLTFDLVFVDTDGDSTATDYLIWAMMLLGAAFGGIHCAAWNYSFPSLAESLIWRVSAIMVVGLPLLLAATLNLHVYSKSFKGVWKNFDLVRLVLLFCLVLYIPARIFLWIETFISFRSAPEGIYQQLGWPNYLGHIGS